jgi:hypothetical protein
METHTTERDIKAEQHHIPPDMPNDPNEVEHIKRNVIGANVAVIATVVGIFIAAIIIAVIVF